MALLIQLQYMFLLLRKIEITASENPKKLEPVSPINVFAGLKLYGKNPTIAPDKAVIKIIDINGDLFKEKIINKDKHEIKETPEDSPSSPSIKLIAFVIPTIQHIVNIYEKVPFNLNILSKNGILNVSIFVPVITTIIAAIICANNFITAGIPLVSSIKQVMDNTNIPIKYPNNLAK